MAREESIIDLLTGLCRLQLKNYKRVYLIQPTLDRDAYLKLLKLKLYNTLFDSIREINKLTSDNSLPVRKEVDRILCHAFNLRIQRRFDEAYRLEQLLETLLLTYRNEKDDIFPVLAFISALINTSQKPETPCNSVIGVNFANIPLVYSNPVKEMCLPDGPLYYGDSKTLLLDKQCYMHYPRQMFEAQQHLWKDDEISRKSVFDLSPGSSLLGDGLFSVKGYMNDAYEKNNKFSLFGALIQSKITSFDVRLELPEFNGDKFIPEIRLPKTMSYGQLSEDEGFVESRSEFSSSVTSYTDESPVEENIWERALSHIQNKHYTWERIGCEPGLTEKPYVTESGTDAFDHLCLHKIQQTCLLYSELVLPEIIEITQQCMVKDVLNVLIGVPSNTFTFDEKLNHFNFKSGVFVTGHSSESLCSFLSEFMECGSHYKTLEDFSKPLPIDSFYEAGLVFQAFSAAIRKILQYYRGVVLTISKDSTLMEVKYMCHRLLIQLRFLVNICLYKIKSSPDNESHFPKGIELISYLYGETVESNSTDNYPMMLSMLQTTCAPFVLFLQNWVFHGIYQDLYGEFTIQVNHRFLESRERQYWTNSFTLNAKNIEECVPVFLSDMASDIILCGKTLNLLKLCCPEHFMCNVSDHDIPKATITFSEEELQNIGIQCQRYFSRMKQVARQVTFSRQEKQRRIEEAKSDLIRKAHNVAAGKMMHLQNIINDQKKAWDLKKRKEFQRLKTQMNEDLLRRATEEENTKADEKKYIDAFTRREDAISVENKRLEDQAREEIVAYYSELGEEAARREQKALWKVRRARLEIERNKFLLEDAARWMLEMDELKEAEKVFMDKEPELPTWASDRGTSAPGSVKSALPISDLPDVAIEDHSAVDDDFYVEPLQVDDGSSSELIPDLKSSKLVPDTLELKDNSESSDVPKPVDGVRYSVTVPESDAKGNPKTSDELKPQDISEIEDDAESKGDTSFSDDKHVVRTGEDNRDKIRCNDGTDGISYVCIHKELPADYNATLDEEVVESDDKNKCSAFVSEIASTTMNDQSPNTPGKTLVRTSVKMNESFSAGSETESTSEKHHVKLFEASCASKETTDIPDIRSSVKNVTDKFASLETIEEAGTKISIKFVQDQHCNKESEWQDKKFSIKINPMMHSSQETEATMENLFPKLKPGCGCASDETQQKEWKIKPESIFGHSSQMSQTYRSIIPKLKRIPHRHINFESDFKDCSIKPRIRISKTISVNKESDEPDSGPKIRKHINPEMHPSKESTFVDLEKMRNEKFRERNIFGHASNSSVQRLLYADRLSKVDTNADTEIRQLLPQSDWVMIPVEVYDTEFDHFEHFPKVDLMSSIPQSFGIFGDYGTSQQKGVEKYTYLSLPSVLRQSMLAPLRAQIGLVNKCIVDYFFVELQLEEHFEALRRYLFMEDGDFSQIFSDALLDKLASNPLPQELLNPVFLNGVLKKSLQSSIHSNDNNLDNLSFVLKFIPNVFKFISHDTLDCLELRYKVNWPVNIILTEACMSKYGLVFSFMLQLKRIVWVLKDVWYRLKKDSIIKKAGNSPEFRQLQLYRQEMQHFVKVMQGYIANQIIHVTWQEFQDSLSKEVSDLDDLYKVHGQYLEKAIFRCLLNTKAKPVMKIIQDIFSLILKFRIQMLSGDWKIIENYPNMTHSNFKQMSTLYKAFRQYSVFLFEVVNKLAVRGYQPHLQELLLRLNFNNYYKG